MKTEIIKNSALFFGMKDDEIKKCLSDLKAHEKSYKKGEFILNAGDVTDSMGMVLSGSVTIESNDIWGNRTILSHVGEQAFFAETYALLSDEIMLVDVCANEDCRILFLRVGNILVAGTKYPFNDNTATRRKTVLLKNLLRISSQKNLMLSGRSFHTSLKSCRGRLLSYLNAVSLKTRSKEFTIPFDRQQLADYLNLERTNMSKELTRMKKEGIIECRKSHFKLLT